MLEIKDISFSYPRRRDAVLSGISLTVKPGGVYGLLGANGVGKSTLLYLIAGLLTPSRGEVTLDGVNTRKRLPATLADMFLVPEEFDLPKISLDQYVRINAPFYPRFSHEMLKKNLETFDLCADINLGSLSMGQKKKAYMSFALAANTPLLLMDEPTNGLDIPGKASFRSFIASNMTDDRSILISTHQVRDINLLLDHIIIMQNDGVLVNSSVADITESYRFGLTNDPVEIETALFARPGLGGASIVAENNDGAETELDLETFFEFATTQTASLHRTLKSNPSNTELS